MEKKGRHYYFCLSASLAGSRQEGCLPSRLPETSCKRRSKVDAKGDRGRGWGAWGPENHVWLNILGHVGTFLGDSWTDVHIPWTFLWPCPRAQLVFLSHNGEGVRTGQQGSAPQRDSQALGRGLCVGEQPARWNPQAPGGRWPLAAKLSTTQQSRASWHGSTHSPTPPLRPRRGPHACHTGIGFLSLLSNGSAVEGTRAFDFAAAVMVTQLQ